jgi:hypothetical protein
VKFFYVYQIRFYLVQMNDDKHMLIFVVFGQSNYANLGITAKFQYAVNTNLHTFTYYKQ